jgi:DNA-binding beta-propeller fold protein YncE
MKQKLSCLRFLLLPFMVLPMAPFSSPARAGTAAAIRPMASWTLASRGGFAFGFGSAWVADGSTVLRINPNTNRTARRIGVNGTASWLFSAADSIWAATSDGTVRIDPRKNRVVGKVKAGRLFAFGSLWDVTSDGDVIRIDPGAGEVTARVHIQASPNWQPQISAGFGSIWVASADLHEVVRIDAKTNRVIATITGFSPADSLLAIGVGFGSVWADENAGANGRGLVYRINPSTNKIVKTIRASRQLGGQYGATQVAFGAGSAWFGNANSTISRIDPRTNRVRAAPKISLDSEFIAYGFNSIWICDDSGNAVRIGVRQFKSR